MDDLALTKLTRGALVCGYDQTIGGACMACDILLYKDIEKFHDEYYRHNRPVVLRGIREALPLKIFNWSADYFNQVMPDKVFPVYQTRSGYLSYERDPVEMPFKEFVRRSFGAADERDSQLRYYFRNRLGWLPEGHDDSQKIEALAPYIKRSPIRNLWISSSAMTVALHFDAADNLNFQLKGNKTFILYPPGTRAYYPESMFSQTAHISRIYRDGPSPDFGKFPRFDPSKAINVELSEGDVLYLPAYWWHHVHSLAEQNVNMNVWWLPTIAKQVANWNQAVRGHVQIALRYIAYRNLREAPAANEPKA